VLREKHNLTQDEIATKAALSVRQVSRLETGNQKLNTSAASRLAKAHGMDLDSYLGKLINTCAKIEDMQLISY
jgi:transcriptional regulator with XRE-family HTH domain